MFYLSCSMTHSEGLCWVGGRCSITHFFVLIWGCVSRLSHWCCGELKWKVCFFFFLTGRRYLFAWKPKITDDTQQKMHKEAGLACYHHVSNCYRIIEKETCLWSCMFASKFLVYIEQAFSNSDGWSDIFRRVLDELGHVRWKKMILEHTVHC